MLLRAHTNKIEIFNSSIMATGVTTQKTSTRKIKK